MNHLKGRKKIFCILVSLIICWFLLPDATTLAEKKPIEHVILISVGGLNYEAYVSVPVPNMKNLIADGVVSEKTLAVQSDTLEAAEASMLTGALTQDHKHLTVNDRVEVESIFELLKKNGRSILVVDGSGGKLQSFSHGDKEYRKIDPDLTSRGVLEEASRSISNTKPYFTYIYIHDCADALLKMDQRSYSYSIKKFDIELGDFLQRLKTTGIYDNSLIIVSSARSSSPSNMVPLIMRGPGCKINSSTEGAMIIDVVPTICRLTAHHAPLSVRGIPIYGAMTFDEAEQPAFFNEWIHQLQKDRMANWNMNYSLDDQLNRTIHQMNSIKEEKQSMFDFAGEREQIIVGLKTKLTMERSVWGGILLLLMLGYVVEYFWLKRKFLLFR